MKSRDNYVTFDNVRIETWRKSCLPIFQMPLSVKWSIHERSSASSSSSSNFLVSSIGFCNFSSFLKHRHRWQRKVSSSTSPAEVWHISSCNSETKCFVESLCNRLWLFACSLSAWHVKHSIACLYMCDAFVMSWLLAIVTRRCPPTLNVWCARLTWRLVWNGIKSTRKLRCSV